MRKKVRKKIKKQKKNQETEKLSEAREPEIRKKTTNEN